MGKQYPDASLIKEWQVRARALRKALRGWNWNVDAVYSRHKKHLVEEIDRVDKLEEISCLDFEDMLCMQNCQRDFRI